jgi:fido (protein-threonine AMPylation protein)
MFDFIGGTRQLSTGYIKELHAALLRNQDTYAVVDQLGRAFEKHLEKGQYKTEPNSPTRPDSLVHEYCPPEQVASEMDRLVAMHSEHAERGVPVEVEAAWFHHRFTQIHPFADGNGRVARAIASLEFIKAGWFPLIVKRDDWSRYVEALEKADQGDLRPVVSLFVESQRNALIVASEAAYDIRPISSPKEAIVAVRDRLMQRGRLPLKEWRRASETAEKLVYFANTQFNEIVAGLSAEISSLSRSFSFTNTREEGLHDPVRMKMIEAAGHLPNLEGYSALLRLHLIAGRRDYLVLSFHGIGPGFRGMVGVTAYLAIEGTEPEAIENAFQINYEEDLTKAQERFSTWLERVIVEGLKQWRRTL